MQIPHKRPELPFITSRYLGREVLLDELGDLSDQELDLLETEAHGIQGDFSEIVARAIRNCENYSSSEKMVRVAGRFIHAIDRERCNRNRSRSFYDLTQSLAAVTAERDSLRRQLDHLLATAN